MPLQPERRGVGESEQYGLPPRRAQALLNGLPHQFGAVTVSKHQSRAIGNDVVREIRRHGEIEPVAMGQVLVPFAVALEVEQARLGPRSSRRRPARAPPHRRGAHWQAQARSPPNVRACARPGRRPAVAPPRRATGARRRRAQGPPRRRRFPPRSVSGGKHFASYGAHGVVHAYPFRVLEQAAKSCVSCFKQWPPGS